MPHVVAVILGSDSDLKHVDESGMLESLTALGLTWELSVISAHRNPDALRAYCLQNESEHKGVSVYIAVAGMAAHLPGVLAAELHAARPVIGVPIPLDVLDGMDALLSMVRMPPGFPVAVPGIGRSGLRNAAILAAQILAGSDPTVAAALDVYVKKNWKLAQVRILKGGPHEPESSIAVSATQ